MYFTFYPLYHYSIKGFAPYNCGIYNSNKLGEIYVSITADKAKNNNIISEKTVCLKISNLIFSLCLSFIMDWYIFMPLTAKASMHGMKIIFCKSILVAKNIIPFPNTPYCNTS